jgi:hypothetical protein
MATDPLDREPPAPPGAYDMPVAADSPTSFSAMPPVTAPAQREREPEPLARREGKPRAWIVVVGIGAAIVISLLAISLLYYKWYKAEDYETTIVVWAWPEWKGATVEVTGSNLPEAKLTRDLDDPDHMVIRFHVPPGGYTVRVLKNGTTLDERSTPTFQPLTARMIWWPFRASPAATQMSAK